ncbi:related to Cys2-His2 zinc finger transcription factor ACEI [Rhynchosporium graminicola]|uniref:Related to Cys2-His2 zinc finger transcription factor ACEI n=1 Tax=Rhynchosporium graminicola TaxID=2792576 RepID=A0A1E1JT66_9HELO|nr:related to Cys2-His2 zinc finger transcription factor ACEI [Rhynchosporium commune]
MSFNHPRRTTKTTSSPLTPTSSGVAGHPTSNTNMSLRKGATFHSPNTTPEREVPPHFKVPSLPRRSQTTLEDVVDAHKRRVALTLGDIDRGLLAAAENQSPTTRQSFPDEANPVPQGFLDHTVASPTSKSYGPTMAGVMDLDPAASRRSLRPRPNRRPSRCSDSGLGSSIGSKSGKIAADTQPTSVSNGRSAKSIVAASAITRSAAAHSSTIESLPRLSQRASNRINEHILMRLLSKPSLKDFHPIIKDCPRRIHSKEIVCLRDLEKTLIFMAPVSETHDDVVGGVAHWFSRLKESTKSIALYLDFCLTSIQCIQATVEFLSDREQTRPHDRPYTNGYFIDLVDQIQQYAQQVQTAKDKEEKGEKIGEMDPESYVHLLPALRRFESESGERDSPIFRPRYLLKRSNFANLSSNRTDEVVLHGGLTKNGRPAELVRVKKNGKAISIATGLPVDMEEESKDAMRFKRSLSEEAEEDEAVLRSMARRKKSATAAELAPKRCREPGCDKEFKRPCDLTKHEKTHSRPWKCPVASCKYHEYGWPTEKEMDRHHNDKHSSAPPLYECHFKPCPYRSKRESNCKQHMEKAHGWTYVRSKNNGKNRDQGSATSNTHPPNTGLPTPTVTNMHTPSSDGNMVATPEDDDFMTGYEGSVQWDPQQLDFPSYPSDEEMFAPGHGGLTEYSPVSDPLNSNGPSPFLGVDNTDDQFATFDNFQPNGNADFNLFENEDLYSARVQLPTPSHDIFNMSPCETSGMTFSNPMPHISPVGHGNTMLYTPTSLHDVDEGFEDFMPSNCNLGNDFQLYPSSTGGTIASTAPSALFGEIPNTMNHLSGASARQLLDFYAASTAAVTGNAYQGMMDWSMDDQFNPGYRSQ